MTGCLEVRVEQNPITVETTGGITLHADPRVLSLEVQMPGCEVVLEFGGSEVEIADLAPRVVVEVPRVSIEVSCGGVGGGTSVAGKQVFVQDDDPGDVNNLPKLWFDTDAFPAYPGIARMRVQRQ